jgi:hypothetical protein
VPQSIVECLEVVNVEEYYGQSTVVLIGPLKFPLQVLIEVASIVESSQRVDVRETLQLPVVIRFDIPTRQEAEDTVADSQVTTIVKLRSPDADIVNERRIGAAQIGDLIFAIRQLFDTGVLA